MRRFALFALCFVLAGCASGGPMENGSLPYDDEMKAYVKCSMFNARDVAHQPGDPLSLGIAADAMCGQEKSRLSMAMARANGPGFAMDMMEAFEERSARRNAGLIVQLRQK